MFISMSIIVILSSFFLITSEYDFVSVFLIFIIFRYQILLVSSLCTPKPPFEFDSQPNVRISYGRVRASDSTCECMDISLTFFLTLPYLLVTSYHFKEITCV